MIIHHRLKAPLLRKEIVLPAFENFFLSEVAFNPANSFPDLSPLQYTTPISS